MPDPTTGPARAPESAVTVARPQVRLAGAARHAWTLLTDRPLSLYAVSVLRIGYGLLYLVFLLREFPHRDAIWGPGSPWTPDLARQLFDQTGWVSVLTLSDSRLFFELCYAAALVVSFLFLLGWRTRRGLGALRARCGSVPRAVDLHDGRRRQPRPADGALPRPHGIGPPLVPGRQEGPPRSRRPTTPARAATPTRGSTSHPGHGGAQLRTPGDRCPGLLPLRRRRPTTRSKGGTWGAGTALHYVLNLDLFQPWPALSHWADEQVLAIAVVGYLTVLLQVAFPFVLFGRLKYPVLTMLLSECTSASRCSWVCRCSPAR
ncbi:hypothetical protein SBADM41S_06647 [Streptomyces badius]